MSEENGVESKNKKEKRPKRTKKDKFSIKQKSGLKRAIGSISNAIENSKDTSVTAEIVKKAGRLDLKTKESGLLNLIPLREATRKFIKPMKRKVSAMKEESATFTALNFIGRVLLATRLRIFGILFLSFGIYSVVAAFAISYIEYGNILHLNYTNAIVAAIIVILSLVLLSGGGKKTLAQGVCESRILSSVLFGLLGIKEENLRKENNAASMNSLVAFICGMILGIVSMFVPMMTIITRFILALLAVIVFIVPEAGIVIAFLAIPFIDVISVVIMTSYIWICFIFKLILGKRTFKLSFTDCCAILFAFITSLSFIISVDSSSGINAFIYSGFILTFVLVSTLIKSREWLTRCKSAIYISTAIVAIWTLLEYIVRFVLTYVNQFVSSIDLNSVIEDLEIDINAISVFDNYEILAVYIMMTVFFVISRYETSNDKSVDRRSLLVFVVCMLVLILSKSWTSWIGFAVGFILYLVHKNRKAIYGIFTTIIAMIVGVMFVPEEFLSRVIAFCNFETPSLFNRIGVWAGSIKMSADRIFGIGISKDVFSDLYGEYAVFGSESAEHSYNLYLQTSLQTGLFSFVVFAMLIILILGSYSVWSKSDLRGDNRPVRIGHAGICSMVAVLVHGILDYVFYDYSLLVEFYMLLGLVYACCKIMRDEADGKEKINETVYYFDRSKKKEVNDNGSEKEIES